MISVLDSAVFGELFGVDDRLAAAFSDEQRVADLIEVEVALASAQANAGVIPAAAAAALAQAARVKIDLTALGASVARSAVPTIELVRQLRDAVGPEMAPFVHRGATSQDVVDTAAVLAIRRATKLIEARLGEAVAPLIDLATEHRHTLMAGRTHAQHASPITFGLKAANWLAPFARHSRRFEELKPRLFVVQFGGASGTMAALGDSGPAVARELARELGLGDSAPWHTQRDAVGEYGNWLALVCDSFGKIGQDLILLAQTEVSEVLESGDGARGGSSTMPHKANPIAGEMMVVAARAAGALLAALHAGAIQEHERATHGWQLEWFALPQMVALTYGAAGHGAAAARRLRVDGARMRRNMSDAGDLVLAESLALALADAMADGDARTLVAHAASEAQRSRGSLVDAVRRAAGARGIDAAVDWERLADPANYLGAADQIIDRILEEARRTVR